MNRNPVLLFLFWSIVQLDPPPQHSVLPPLSWKEPLRENKAAGNQVSPNKQPHMAPATLGL